MRPALNLALISILTTASSATAQVTLDHAALQRSYPRFAKEIGIGGKVILDCTPADGRQYSCQAISEAPVGFGFAQAGLEASRTLRVQGVARRITLPLVYVPPDGPPVGRAPSAESLALARALLSAGGVQEELMRSSEAWSRRGVGLEQLSPEVRAAAEASLTDLRSLLVEAFVNMEAHRFEERVPAAMAPELTRFVSSDAGRELLGLLAERRLDKRTAQAWADRHPEAMSSFQRSVPALSAMAVPPREAEARLRVEFDESIRVRLCKQVRCT